MRRKWADHEIETLKAMYPNTKTSRIAKMLNRTERCVFAAATILGLKKSAEYLASPEACRLRCGSHEGT